MAIIRTLEGEYYELPDDLLEKYRVPHDVVRKQTARVREPNRMDIAGEFKALKDESKKPNGGEPT